MRTVPVSTTFGQQKAVRHTIRDLVCGRPIDARRTCSCWKMNWEKRLAGTPSSEPPITISLIVLWPGPKSGSGISTGRAPPFRKPELLETSRSQSASLKKVFKIRTQEEYLACTRSIGRSGIDRPPSGFSWCESGEKGCAVESFHVSGLELDKLGRSVSRTCKVSPTGRIGKVPRPQGTCFLNSVIPGNYACSVRDRLLHPVEVRAGSR